MRIRADDLLVQKGLVQSRSQAANLIRLGKVWIAARQATKPGQLVYDHDGAEIKDAEIYVSRAGFKLASVSETLGINFKGSTVLDVGSSTGGFTDYALQHGATRVIAVDVGTDQMHASLRQDERIELYEKTDIRNFVLDRTSHIDLVVIDVSFISLREILPHISRLLCKTSNLKPQTSLVIAMVKPQFEAGTALKHKGVIKNDTMRREILKDFEGWVKDLFVIVNKADSEVSGAKGNQERFYVLKPLQK